MWLTLVRAATIGTDRQPFILPKAEDERLDRLLAQIDTTNPAKALLSAAALLSLAEKAGRVPVVPDFEAVSLCPPEDVPICGQQGIDCLQRMLVGEEFPEVLPEWLATVAAAQLQVPPEYIPDLLNWGNRHLPWRTQILSVVGHRGKWLAAQNPDWQYAEGLIDRSIWDQGTSGMRLWTLQLLRDRDPAQARDWVSSTWKQDKAPDRAAFLGLFKTGLSLADEFILELALDDKSKQVRAIAADLLARMPDSQLTHRAIERMKSVICFVTQPIFKLEITLLNADSEMARRDGIISQSSTGMGEKAKCLVQMLAQVPPSVWTTSIWTTSVVGGKVLNVDGEGQPNRNSVHPLCSGESLPIPPGEWLRAAVSSEWAEAILEGIAIATERHQNVEWAEALLTVLPRFPSSSNHLNELSHSLMEILPIDRRESLVWQVLEQDTSDRLKKNHPLLFLLRCCRHLWSIELSLAVLHRVAIEISTSQDNYNWGVRSTIRNCAYFINPTVIADADQLLKGAAKAESYWEQTVEEVLEILQFRHEMLKEIFSNSSRVHC